MEKKIGIISEFDNQEEIEATRMFSLNKSGRSRNFVDVEILKSNVEDFYDSLSVVLSDLKQQVNGYDLDEISINAEVGGDGSINLFGSGVKASAKAGITFKFTKSKPS